MSVQETAAANSQWSYYLAYPSSQRLHQNAVDFLDTYANKPAVNAAPLLADMMESYIPEMLEAYMRKPTDLAGIGPTGKKVVDMSTSAMSKTAAGLTKQILKKSQNKDLVEIRGHIESMVLTPEDTELGIPLSAIEISEELYGRCVAMIERIQTQPPSEYHDEVIEFLLELVEVISEEVMKKPIAMMPLGPIVKKMANLGMDTILTAALKVVKGVFGKMSDEELFETSKYFDELLVKSPRS